MNIVCLLAVTIVAVVSWLWLPFSFSSAIKSIIENVPTQLEPNVVLKLLLPKSNPTTSSSPE